MSILTHIAGHYNMNKFFLIIITLFYSSGLIISNPDETTINSILKNFGKPSYPSASVILTKDNIIKEQVNIGYADIQKKKNIKPNLQYPLGFLTTHYTTIAALLLEKEGQLNLNEIISGIIPDLPDCYKNIKVINLLKHNSGIVNFIYSDEKVKRNSITEKEIFAYLIENDSLIFKTGSKWDYNIANYVLLVKIIEIKSGMDYNNYVKLNIIDKLSLKNTTVLTGKPIKAKKMVVGYNTPDNIKFSLNDDYKSYFIKGVNNIYASINDFNQIIEVFTSDKLVSDSKIKEIFKFHFKPGLGKYVGYNWYVEFINGKLCYHSANNSFGTTHSVFIYPEEKITVIVLTNHGSLFGLRDSTFDIINLISKYKFLPQPKISH